MNENPPTNNQIPQDMQPNIPAHVDKSGIRVINGVSYRDILKIGSGTYGTVFSATAMATETSVEERVALKRIKLDDENEGIASSALREVLILKSLKNENIVELKSVYSSDRRMTMIFECCDMDLKKYFEKCRIYLHTNRSPSMVEQMTACNLINQQSGITPESNNKSYGSSENGSNSHGSNSVQAGYSPNGPNLVNLFPHDRPVPLTYKLTPKVVKNFLYQMLNGLKYCHLRSILHRDLKPQNILLTENGVLKLADFGLARAIGIPVTVYSAEVVTLWYRPPDVLLGAKIYDDRLDVWSMGCILAELSMGGKPFLPGSNVDDQLRRIVKVFGCPTEKTWPGFKVLPHLRENHVISEYMFERGLGLSNTLEAYTPNGMVTGTSSAAETLGKDGMDLINKLLVTCPFRRYTCIQALEHPYFTK